MIASGGASAATLGLSVGGTGDDRSSLPELIVVPMSTMTSAPATPRDVIHVLPACSRSRARARSFAPGVAASDAADRKSARRKR